MVSTLIFDFDGTLVDSAPGILRSFELVLSTQSIQPLIAVDERLIGPPLAQTMSKITGVTEPAELARLVELFKAAYDSEGFKATTPYPGLRATLGELAEAGYELVIVTNKRRVPTLAILDYLDIDRYFHHVFTPDTWQPAVTSKIDTLARAIDTLGLAPAQCLMVGDSIDDAHAAAVNGLGFVAVSFGYGTAASQTEFPRLLAVDALPRLTTALAALR